MRVEKDELIFSSGRRVYAHCCIIGIAPDLSISYGYDGGITWPIPDWWTEEEKQREMTADDARELADYMIAQWTKFKDAIPK